MLYNRSYYYQYSRLILLVLYVFFYILSVFFLPFNVECIVMMSCGDSFVCKKKCIDDADDVYRMIQKRFIPSKSSTELSVNSGESY